MGYMLRKYFKVNISLDQKLITKILKILNNSLNDRGGETLLELAKDLKFDLEKKGNWYKLRYHLDYLEGEKMLEERHFQDGVVDYCIENSGVEYLRNLNDESHIVHTRKG